MMLTVILTMLHDNHTHAVAVFAQQRGIVRGDQRTCGGKVDGRAGGENVTTTHAKDDGRGEC